MELVMIGKQGSRLFIWAVGVFSLGLGMARAGDLPHHALRETEPVEGLDEYPGILALEEIPILEEAGSTCQSVGGFDLAFSASGRSRYRGNAIKVTLPDVKIVEFKMQLVVPSATTLYFSIHQKNEQDGTYQQIFLKSINVAGSGAATFYPSGLLVPGGLPLPQNGTFALGVAWGSSASVTYARNNLSNPRPISVGQLLGNVQLGGTTTPVTPPIAEELPPLTILTAGAYSMQLCFEPAPGACCSPAFFSTTPPPPVNLNGCREVLETSCTAPGSYFHGERTSCASTPCQLGACCTKCNDPVARCKGNYTPQACEAEFGAHLGTGSPCPTAELIDVGCPLSLGACCVGGTCTHNMCERDCLDSDGAWMGEGTVCPPPGLNTPDSYPNICVAACCVPNSGCVDVTPEFCTQFLGGTPKNRGTVCARLDAGQQCGGACSYYIPAAPNPIIGCDPVSSREDCTVAEGVVNGVYLGDASTCVAPYPRMFDLGACCNLAGTCSLQTQPQCPNHANDPQAFKGAGTVCGSICPTYDSLGACCLPSGACITVSGVVCSNLAGAHEPLVSCDDFLDSGESCEAAQPCCFNDGSCGEFTSDTCTGEFGGTPAGSIGQACSLEICGSELPQGACCTPVGVCSRLSEPECEALDPPGRFLGEATTCGEGSCPGFGACCKTDGGCVDSLTEQECNLRNPTPPSSLPPTHTYKGAGSQCAFQNCDETGACCTADGCISVSQAECATLGGNFNEEGQCPEACPSGACCTATGCVVASDLRCDVLGGSFLKDGECPGACSDGACCRGVGGCENDVPAAACTEPDDFFLGADVLCAQSDCTRGACCHGDGTCDSNRLDDQCVATNDVFTPNQTCAGLNPACEGLSTCCLPNGLCTQLRSADCLAAAGTPLGTTPCAAGTCVSGVCCDPENACTNALDATCDDRFIAGANCDQLPCEPHGACCDDGACSNGLAESTCAANGGTFQGEATACGVCGSCCGVDGTCRDVLGFLCNTTAGEIFTPGGDCDGITCTVRGACCRTDSIQCQLLTRAACEDLPKESDPTYAGDGVLCEPNLCNPGACCLEDGSCVEERLLECRDRPGRYASVGSCLTFTCQEPCEFRIVGSDPPNCAVDAGYSVTGPPAPLRPAANQFTLTFECEPTTVPDANDFVVRVVPAGPAPAITEVTLEGAEATITLSQPIATGQWVCIHSVLDPTEVCLGALPADVNGDGAADLNDVPPLVALVPSASPPLWQCDVDRSNACAAPDIITAIDVINGVVPAGYNPDLTLPACPTTELAVFADPNPGFTTIAVHDVNEEVVYFDPAAQSIIWAADGGERQQGLWPVNGNFIGNFQVRFGTKNGQRRAYFTETGNGFICNLSVNGQNVSISPTQVPVPQN